MAMCDGSVNAINYTINNRKIDTPVRPREYSEYSPEYSEYRMLPPRPAAARPAFPISASSTLDSKIGPNEMHFPLMHEKRDFLNAVKTRGTTLEDAEVGHRTASLGHLGQIAIQLGRKLKWDPDKERFPDDDEANKMLSLPPGRSPWALQQM